MYNKLIKDIKVPFKFENGARVDDTPIHKAIREVLANCIVNTDYYGVRGIVIKKETDCIVIENPGDIRTGIDHIHMLVEIPPKHVVSSFMGGKAV